MKTYKEVLGMMKKADWRSDAIARARRARELVRQRHAAAQQQQQPQSSTAQQTTDPNVTALASAYDKRLAEQRAYNDQASRRMWRANSAIGFKPNTAQQAQIQKKLLTPTGNSTLDAYNRRKYDREQQFKRFYGVGTADYKRNGEMLQAEEQNAKQFMQEQLAEMMDGITPSYAREYPTQQPTQQQLAQATTSLDAPAQTSTAQVQTSAPAAAPKAAVPASTATPQQSTSAPIPKAPSYRQVAAGKGTVGMTNQQAKTWNQRPGMTAIPTRSGGKIWVTNDAYAKMNNTYKGRTPVTTPYGTIYMTNKQRVNSGKDRTWS